MDGVDTVALGASRSANSGDLDNILACLGKDRREPGGEAAGALERPDPSSWRLLATPVQQTCIARAIGAIRPVRRDGPGARCQDREIDGVSVRVTADDVVVMLCKHDHCVSFPTGASAVDTGLGEITCRGSTVRGHVRRRTSS